MKTNSQEQYSYILTSTKEAYSNKFIGEYGYYQYGIDNFDQSPRLLPIHHSCNIKFILIGSTNTSKHMAIYE